MSQILDDLFKSIPKEIEVFVDLSDEIAQRIVDLLKEKNMSQKDLARKLGKSESEISKWLTGRHNFTLKTIANLIVALDRPIVEVKKDAVRSLSYKGLKTFLDVYNNPIGKESFAEEVEMINETPMRKAS